MVELLPGEIPGIGHYLTAAVRKWWVVTPVLLVSLFVGQFAVSHRTPSYAASTRVLLRASPADAGGVLDIPTQADRIASDTTAHAVIARLGLREEPAEVLSKLTVGFSGTNAAIDVVAKDSDPTRAYELSTAFADEYLSQRQAAAALVDRTAMTTLTTERDQLNEHVAALDRELTGLRGQVATLPTTLDNTPVIAQLQSLIATAATNRSLASARLTQLASDIFETSSAAGRRPPTAEVFRAASVPETALGASDLLLRLGCLAGGGLVAVAVAFLLWRRDGAGDRRQQTTRAVGAPVFARVPGRTLLRASAKQRRARDGAYTDAGNRMVRALNQATSRRVLVLPHRSVRRPQEEAIELALASARAGRRTILVSADHARTDLAERLHLRAGQTLVDVLVNGDPLDLMELADTPLSVLPAGALDASSRDLLGSEAMEILLLELEAQHDLVIVEGPALSSNADSAALARLARHAVIVMPDTNPARRIGQQLRTELERFECQTLGVIVAGS